MSRFSSLLAIALASTAAVAKADPVPVLLMVDPARRDAMAEALSIELASRDVELIVLDAPDGETPLARAANAQHACRFVGAAAAVLAEPGPDDRTIVRVVGPEGTAIRHAPLPQPLADVDVRLFAVVANSLVEELFGPPQAPLNVTVDVRVEAPATAPDTTAPDATAVDAPPPRPTGEDRFVRYDWLPRDPPPLVVVRPVAPTQQDGVMDDEAGLLPRSGFFLEGGGMFAGVAAGGHLGLGWQLVEELRLSTSMSMGMAIDGSTFYLPELSLTRIGPGGSGRFDFGGKVGMVFLETIVEEPFGTFDVLLTGWVLTAFFGWTWEAPWAGMGVRAALTVSELETGDPIVAPMATLHAELPI